MVLPINDTDVGEVILKLITEIGLEKLSSRLIREKLTDTFKVVFGKEHKEEIDMITKEKIAEIHTKQNFAEQTKENFASTPASPAESSSSHEETPSQSFVTEKATPKPGIRFAYCIVFAPKPIDEFVVVPHDMINGRMIVGKPIKLKMPTWEDAYSCTIRKLCVDEDDANLKMREFIAKKKAEVVPKNELVDESTKDLKAEKSAETTETMPPTQTSPKISTPEPPIEKTPRRRGESPSPNGLVIDETPGSSEPENEPETSKKPEKFLGQTKRPAVTKKPAPKMKPMKPSHASSSEDSSDSSSESEPEAIKSKAVKKVSLKDILKKKPKPGTSTTPLPILKKNPAKKTIGPPPGFKSIRNERDEKMRAMREERSETLNNPQERPNVSTPVAKEDTPQPNETPKSQELPIINSTSDESSSTWTTPENSKMDISGSGTPISTAVELPKNLGTSTTMSTSTVVKRNPAKKTIVNNASRKIVAQKEEKSETVQENGSPQATPKEPPSPTVINFLKNDNNDRHERLVEKEPLKRSLHISTDSALEDERHYTANKKPKFAEKESIGKEKEEMKKRLSIDMITKNGPISLSSPSWQPSTPGTTRDLISTEKTNGYSDKADVNRIESPLFPNPTNEADFKNFFEKLLRDFFQKVEERNQRRHEEVMDEIRKIKEANEKITAQK
uniref:Uncharacterized protein n=1 Tax=Acrobeloides nanus TaxID=290746 RepID=A0A914C473_9BILA